MPLKSKVAGAAHALLLDVERGPAARERDLAERLSQLIGRPDDVVVVERAGLIRERSADADQPGDGDGPCRAGCHRDDSRVVALEQVGRGHGLREVVPVHLAAGCVRRVVQRGVAVRDHHDEVGCSGDVVDLEEAGIPVGATSQVVVDGCDGAVEGCRWATEDAGVALVQRGARRERRDGDLGVGAHEVADEAQHGVLVGVRPVVVDRSGPVEHEDDAEEGLTGDVHDGRVRTAIGEEVGGLGLGGGATHEDRVAILQVRTGDGEVRRGIPVAMRGVRHCRVGHDVGARPPLERWGSRCPRSEVPPP